MGAGDWRLGRGLASSGWMVGWEGGLGWMVKGFAICDCGLGGTDWFAICVWRLWGRAGRVGAP